MSSEWLKQNLGDVVQHKKGFAFKSKDYLESGVPVVRVSNFTENSISPDDLKFVSQAVAQENAGVSLHVGDIVVATVGSWPNNPASVVGRTISVPAWANQALMNQNSVILRARSKSSTDQRFIYYQMKSSDFAAHVVSKAQGSANQASITLEAIFSFPLFWPELQHRVSVVETLSAIDDRIDLLRETNVTLEAIAQALFKSWFVDFDPVHAKARGEQPEALPKSLAALFPNSFEESSLGLVPRGWSMSTLGVVCDSHGGTIQTGPFGSQLHASDYVPEGIPVVMPKDISDRRVDAITAARIRPEDAERLSRHQLQVGDIVFSRRGDVEKHALIGEVERGWLCGTGCLLVRPGSRWNSPGFLSRSLDLQQTKLWLTQHAVGATMPNLNTGILAAVPVLLPSQEVLSAFEQSTRVLDERISENNGTAQTLATLRDTLLPRLISGQLRLREAEGLMQEVVL